MTDDPRLHVDTYLTAVPRDPRCAPHPRADIPAPMDHHHHDPEPPCPRDGPIPIIAYSASSTQWLWNNYLPIGEITLLAGNPGAGKSLLALDLAARASTGRPWPNEPSDVSPPQLRPPANVLLASDDDHLSSTILPRLSSAEADLSHLFLPENYILPEKRLLLPRDVYQISDQLWHLKNTRLIILDPLISFLDDTCFTHGRNAYAAFSAIKLFAQECQCAIIAILHLGKTNYHAAIHRIPGGTALAAVARNILVAVPDRREENPDPARRLLVPIKNNLAPLQPPLAYSIRNGRIHWLPETETCLNPDILLSISPARPGPDPVKLDACIAWLAAQLQSGPLPRTQLAELGAAAGYSLRTLSRAKNALGLRSFPGPASTSLWAMANISS